MLRQANMLAALFENYDELEKAQKVVADSAGLTAKRYNIYLDSMEAKTNEFTATWEKLVSNTTNSDVAKGFVGFGTSVLNVVDALGLLNVALVASLGFMGSKMLVAIPGVTAAIDSMAVSMGIATGAATTLSSVLTASLLGVAIVAVIAGFKLLNKSAVDTYNNFEKLKSQTDDNKNELNSLAEEYQQLANKQNKNGDEIVRLLDIQSILNTKYGAAKDGINLYTDAINNNTTAIQKNISWIEQQAEAEAKSFLNKQKFAYQDAQKYLKTAIGTKYGKNQFSNMVPEEAIENLDKLIEEGKDWSGTLRKLRDSIYEQVDANKKIIIQYEEYEHVLNNAGTMADEMADRWYRVGDAAQSSSEDLEKLIQTAKDLNDTFLSNDQTLSQISEDYKKYGQITLEQAQALTQMGYAEALSIDTSTGKITIKIGVLHALVVADANAAAASARRAYEVAVAQNADVVQTQAIKEKIKALWAEYQALLAVAGALAKQPEAITTPAITTGFGGGGGGSAKTEQEKQYSASKLLQQIISLIRQQKQEEIDEIKVKQNAIKQQQEGLQDQLDGYKKIIDARKKLLQTEQDELEYKEELEDKNKSISKLQSDIKIFELDTSQESKAERLKLQDELNNQIEDRDKLQRDKSYSKQEEALDNEYDLYEEYINGQDALLQKQYDLLQTQIDKINDYLSRSGEVSRDAIAMMVNQSGDLYNKLIDWNNEYGDGIRETVTRAWEEAYKALEKYGNLADALLGLENPNPSTGTGGAGGGGGGGTPTPKTTTPVVIPPGYGGQTDPTHPTYDSGLALGPVGGVMTPAFRVIANLASGEGVLTPNNMMSIIRNIPQIANNIVGMGRGNITIEKVLEINGNVDRSSIPEIERAAQRAIDNLAKQIGLQGGTRRLDQMGI